MNEMFSISTIGWIATALSAFASMSPIPQALKLRKRGSLDGENLNPWLVMLVYDASVCIYAFNPDAYKGYPLKVWVFIDVVVATFLVLTAFKAIKDDRLYDQYSLFLWSCGVVIPMTLLFINNVSLIGFWMILLAVSNAVSVFSSFYRIFKYGYDEDAEKSFDPLMLTFRFVAATVWSIYAFLIDDAYILLVSLWAAFCPLVSLLVYVFIHGKANAIRLANQLRRAELKNRFRKRSKQVVSEIQVIHILSRTTSDLNPDNSPMIPHRHIHQTIEKTIMTTKTNTTTTSPAATTTVLATANAVPVAKVSSSSIAASSAVSMAPMPSSMVECHICMTSLSLKSVMLTDFEDDEAFVALESGRSNSSTEEEEVKSLSTATAPPTAPHGITLRCGHMFCSKCLSRCAEHNMDTCPICRREHELSPQVLKARLSDYRVNYQSWRKGKAKGAKGEVDDITAAGAVSSMGSEV